MELVPTTSYWIAMSWFDKEVCNENLDDLGQPLRRRIIDAYLLIKDDLDLSPLYKAMSEQEAPKTNLEGSMSEKNDV